MQSQALLKGHPCLCPAFLVCFPYFSLRLHTSSAVEINIQNKDLNNLLPRSHSNFLLSWKTGETLFDKACSDRTKGNSFNLKQG